jgi:predicted DsbA family dithiol-disulfide isomerase
MTLRIAIYSDVICPWCFIGKERLEAGLRLAGIDDLEIAWLPYELNPDMPEAGMERTAYLEKKFGPDQRPAIEARLNEAAAADGLTFNWDGVKRTPNTRKAHLLIALASATGLTHDVKSAIMDAYFVKGQDIGDVETLVNIGTAAGLEDAAIRATFTDPARLAYVEKLEAKAHEIGVQGVPYFIVNNRYAISGAQTAEAWAQAIRQISAAETGV